MYDWYFVLDGLEKGVEAQVTGVVDPFSPVCVGGGGASSGDAMLDVFMRSAEITDEVSCALGVTSL